MSNKLLLGIDIGAERLKLVLMKGNTVRKAAVVSMPDPAEREGERISPKQLSELIRDTMHEQGIHCKDAAVVLTGEGVFLKNITMPLMTPRQLRYNLPFEFRDYITEDLQKYSFDYSMISTQDEMLEAYEEEVRAREKLAPGEELRENKAAMELTGVAVLKERLEDLRYILKKAGLRLAAAAPAPCAYGALLAERSGEHCIMDIGYQAIRIFMIRNGHYEAVRLVDAGLSQACEAIAEMFSVDLSEAKTYLEQNHMDCQNSEACNAVWNRISVELMRAINFYRFSNPQSELKNVWICGGGSLIAPLQEEISHISDIEICKAADLLPDSEIAPEEIASILLAAGIAVR